MLFRVMNIHLLLVCTLVLFSAYLSGLQSFVVAVPNSTTTTTTTSSLSTLEIERAGEDLHLSAVKRRSSPYLQLPIFQHSRIPLLDKEQFSPTRGSGREQIPEEMKRVLIPRPRQRATSRRGSRPHGINVACYRKKMVVKVNKQILGPVGFQTELKLGTCDISKTTKHYHLFIYDMEQCGSQRKSINNRVTFSNILHYSPVRNLGPIRRALPFSVPVECHFNRYHYSYKIGFNPQVEPQNHFKPLKTMDSVKLTPRDALWNRLSPTEAYTIGHPMYFQVDGPPLAEGKRLFVDSCYVTLNSSHLSMPRFTVIENYGCMTDSKNSRSSRFIQSRQRNIVRFSLNAFLFHGMLGEVLYIHCEVSVGSLNPTASSKSCTYNKKTKRWEELFGLNDACFCCNSKCLATDLSVTSKVITSEPWTMESDLKSLHEEKTTTPLMPLEVETGMVQVLNTLEAEIVPNYHVTGMAIEEEEAKFVEPRRIFEEVFGLN